MTPIFNEYIQGEGECAEILRQAKRICEARIEEGALTRRVNSKFAEFTLKNNYGWVDERKVSLDSNIKMEVSPERREEIEGALREVIDVEVVECNK